MLHTITQAINFISLMLALWLGLYLVTRSPHRPVTWLTLLALWSMGGFFLNQLLALNPPPAPPQDTQVWLYHLILFWPHNVFELGWSGWLQGWLPSYSIIFWYHVTLNMLPGDFNRGRMMRALAGYLIALLTILIKFRFPSTWINLAGDPLYSSFQSTPFSILFGVWFVAIAALCAFNLRHAAQSTPEAIPREQLRLFTSAILFGGAAGLPGIASQWLNKPVPQALTAFFIAAALILGGIGITRYTARLDNRPLKRDFLYSAAGAGAILLIYMQFHGLFMQLYTLPAISSVLVGCLAVISHSLIDAGRHRLDKLLTLEKNQPLKLRLRQFSRTVRNNNEHKEVEETERDRLSRLKENSIPVIVDQVCPEIKEITPRQVELGLRNLHDYVYLGDSPLADLLLVGQCLESTDGSTPTHIDRGKAVSAVLMEAVSQLKPEPCEPVSTPPRTWYRYLILRDAYLDDAPNRVIMTRLYISEGTFNRTRRAAIESVARILSEKEAGCINTAIKIRQPAPRAIKT